ncbi:hypothetical protein [Aliifodinibius sp. S!AR15-10]|uniref:hypothetical protein n=1 Tax=Aliifodinibius sp. S!AR15-10 TaxID=2950437 RepID=UPI0028705E7B|nr:hypothetical protein [Aliifodinibius sp. S!AR15-10]
MKEKIKTYVCKSCGGEGPVQDGVPCSVCGLRHYILKADTGKFETTGNPIGTTVEGDPNNPLGRRVENRPASGGASNGYRDKYGRFQLENSGPLKNGRENEPHVSKILVKKLRELGYNVKLLVDDAHDNRGEDGILVIDDDKFTLQIVTIPFKNLWEDLSVKNEATLSGDKKKAVSLLHEAINIKKERYSPSDREKMVLALDLTHCGALVYPNYVKAYINHFGDPVKEYLFKSVWLVGPTTRSTIPLSPFHE